MDLEKSSEIVLSNKIGIHGQYIILQVNLYPVDQSQKKSFFCPSPSSLLFWVFQGILNSLFYLEEKFVSI